MIESCRYECGHFKQQRNMEHRRDLSEVYQNNRANSLKRMIMNRKTNVTLGSIKQCTEIKIRVAILGGSGVGKTSVVSQFLFGRFPASGSYIETIEDLYKHRYTESFGEVAMDILDTSGSPDYSCFRDNVIKYCDAFVILYSIGDKNSYEEMRRLREQIIKEKKSDKIPIVIVGNKLDICAKSFMRREALGLVVAGWGHEHVFCTASSPKSVAEIFDTLKALIRSNDIPRKSTDNSLCGGTLFMRPRNSHKPGTMWVKIF
ncbi:hypothetical protein FSP39_011785 [Pinctada imbricata]|uniref:Uncharacterized protein n=1 Tax=Pinctada imbricata TaxID=66713 RepID=A0AA88YE35_PINIB|nr:hypothetical protein FSP39_011785 [Pinctada imbricata]